LVVGLYLLRGHFPGREHLTSWVYVIAFVVFFSSMVLDLLPIVPHFMPVSITPDSAHHYAIIDYIWRYEEIPRNLILSYYMCDYPSGFHLNISLLSKALGILPVHILYPLMCVLLAFTGVAVYQLSLGGGGRNYILASVAGFYFMNSILVFTSLAWSGFWSSIFGLFLTAAFLLFLKDYIKNRNLLSVIILVVTECALIMAYPIYFPATVILFFVFSRVHRGKKGALDLVFYILSGVFLIYYFIEYLSAGIYLVKGPGAAIRTGVSTKIGLLSLLYLLYAVPGFVHSVREGRRKFMVGFAYAVLIQLTVVVFATFFGVADYYIDKIFYLMVLPASVFAVDTTSLILGKAGLVGRVSTTALVLLLIIGTAAFYVGVESLGKFSPVLTSRQYDTALWVSELPQEDVAVLGDPTRSRWFHIISQKRLRIPATMKSYDWGFYPEKYFMDEIIKSDEGEIIALLEDNKVYADRINREEFRAIMEGESIALFERM